MLLHVVEWHSRSLCSRLARHRRCPVLSRLVLHCTLMSANFDGQQGEVDPLKIANCKFDVISLV